MAVTNQRKNQHLLWRAGFGPSAGHAHKLRTASPDYYLKSLFESSGKDPASLEVIEDELQRLTATVAANRTRGEQMNADQEKEAVAQRRQLQAMHRGAIKNLTLAWMNHMVHSEAQLREKMSLFWHGHFACRRNNYFHMKKLLHSIRTHALGNFGDLLRAVSHSPAMLAFLNNQQNRRQSPNENFAREVMELFTLGRGHYTENDVKEAARAFTGWAYNADNEFVFRKNQHDSGVKTVLGKSGNFTGDDVLDILLEHKQTAIFITTRIYRYFVNDDVDETHIRWLADRFYNSGYDIAALMRDVFSAPWFYDAKNIGVRIKSPIEYLVSIRRLLPMEMKNPEVQILLQRALGQWLFYPPNVAGWPGGKTWIDSSTLMLRLRIPQLIADSSEFVLKAKDDDDVMMGMADRSAVPKRPGRNAQQIRATINWRPVLTDLEKVKRDELTHVLTGFLLQVEPHPDPGLLLKYVDQSGREAFIRSAMLRIMGTPEFQLC